MRARSPGVSRPPGVSHPPGGEGGSAAGQGGFDARELGVRTVGGGLAGRGGAAGPVVDRDPNKIRAFAVCLSVAADILLPMHRSFS
ncbi:hypothetical protein Stube_44810 [Streptomyces tubercidicus]|uniref:Uncharacterized protein n=1 Tax=Streptomyces tubercidicus TaxID=47759 RepID=A0A640UUK8_9ACTN|nr:hypothetical protein Stube_44810 [Streptomyces tubercidicus]